LSDSSHGCGPDTGLLCLPVFLLFKITFRFIGY